MRYYRCKCGSVESWSSLGIQPCEGCEKCNTTLEESAEYHETPVPHEWKKRWRINRTGEPEQIEECRRCHTPRPTAPTETPR